MPPAVQICHGSMRLVEVKRFRPDDKADCPFCNARPKGERKIVNGGQTLYYCVPTHRADGTRDASKIDWSQV